MKSFKHISIMPEEVLESFRELKKGSVILDGTLGKGGHSKLLLDKGFKVIGVDRDKEAFTEAKNNLSKFENIQFVNDNFANIKNILKKLNVEKVDGMLVDLGISTHQLESKGRGFGFEGELDMRMNQDQDLTAEDVVNKYPLEKLKKILQKYGEKVYYKQIAEAIVDQREDGEINTAEELVEIIKQCLPEGYRRTRKHHWATPTFRALRIEVNKDIENIESFLDVFHNYLNRGGILSVITFHSLEERAVKLRLQLLKGRKVIKLLTKKGMPASIKEISVNSKAKRAKLWIAMKK